VSLDERRARVRRWSSFRRLQNIVGGASRGGVKCTIFERLIQPGETDYIVTLKGATAFVSIRTASISGEKIRRIN